MFSQVKPFGKLLELDFTKQHQPIVHILISKLAISANYPSITLH